MPKLCNYLFLALYLIAQATFAAEGNDGTSLPTGTMQLSATSADLVGEQAAASISDVLPMDVPIEWQVYVPQNYRPERPPGVLVFVSSNNWGRIPDHWRQVMDARNIIWVSANGDGDGAPLQRQLLKAVLAPRAIDRNYAIDMSRIYVGGIAGGGRVATVIEVSKPEIFMGALYIGRAMRWSMDPAMVEKISANRHVFISSGTGSAAEEVKQVFDAYKDAGIDNALHIRVTKMGREGPDQLRLMQAIDYLDARGQE